MRIATKIAAGFTALIVLMVAVLAYQLLVVNRLSVLNQDLLQINSRAAMLALDLLRIRDLVEENTLKLFLLGDSDYRTPLTESQKEFSKNLREIQTLAHTEAEWQAIQQLNREWERFCAAVTRQEQTGYHPALDELPAAISDSLKQLRAQSEQALQATQTAMESSVESSKQMSQWADLVSWAAAAAALFISFLVSFFVVRSISEPLKRLTAGTQALAAGRYSFRLDESQGDEFAQLAGDFNRMSSKLGELDQLKRDFVSHIGHELKTPLASMRESIHLLLSEIPGALNDKQRRFLQLGARNGERLSEMLSNLLDISRMEAGVMDYVLKDRDLAAIVRAAVEEFEPQAQEKRVRLKAEVPAAALSAECDEERILQVLRNLLSNALKFSPAEAEIVVRLWWEPRIPDDAPKAYGETIPESDRAAGFAVLSVCDSGPGIAEADREGIFDKFRQLHRGTKIAGQGAGLGLAISRTIVQAHGGVIWVDENPDGGSVFHVVLPAGSAKGKIRHRVSNPV